MAKNISLTLEQLNILNLSHAKATALSEMMADCGSDRRTGPDAPSTDALFVVIQILFEELEKIGKVLESCEPLEEGTHHTDGGAG